ncbi:MAG TPA: ABC transporter substrate-binding protein [Bacteroidales bacterium]|nr:ABC transporter substrate-binding protein [Bacteroidales bacterium]
MNIKTYICFFTLILVCDVCNTDRKVAGQIEHFGANNDYATLFDIEKRECATLLSVRNPWQGGAEVTHRYWLVPDSACMVQGKESAVVILTPVRKVVCLSTTHIAMIGQLGEASTIIGVSGTDYVINPLVRRRIEEGRVKEVGYDSNLNSELIASLDPDLVLVYGIGSESAGYISKLLEVNIPVVYISDYLEFHPLARAEWIKVFAALFDKGEVAESYFGKIADDYESIKTHINENVQIRPRILTGLPYKDTWFVSPGNSYMSYLISDAGANYIWKDTRSELSMPMSLESVFMRALDSDIWINIGSVVSLNEIISIDNRFSDLPPVKMHKLYNNIALLNPLGGNDYWESGIIHPEILLKDLASIFHPDIFPEYEPLFYKKIN